MPRDRLPLSLLEPRLSRTERAATMTALPATRGPVHDVANAESVYAEDHGQIGVELGDRGHEHLGAPRGQIDAAAVVGRAELRKPAFFERERGGFASPRSSGRARAGPAALGLEGPPRRALSGAGGAPGKGGGRAACLRPTRRWGGALRPQVDHPRRGPRTGGASRLVGSGRRERRAARGRSAQGASLGGARQSAIRSGGFHYHNDNNSTALSSRPAAPSPPSPPEKGKGRAAQWYTTGHILKQYALTANLGRPTERASGVTGPGSSPTAWQTARQRRLLSSNTCASWTIAPGTPRHPARKNERTRLRTFFLAPPRRSSRTSRQTSSTNESTGSA